MPPSSAWRPDQAALHARLMTIGAESAELFWIRTGLPYRASVWWDKRFQCWNWTTYKVESK